MKKVLLTVLAFAPALVLAGTTGGTGGRGATGISTTGLQDTVQGLTKVVNMIIPLMIAVAVIAFIYGVIKYILAKGPQEQKEARNFLVWSVVGIFAILAVFGIARLLINLFGLSPQQLGPNEVPTVSSDPVQP